MTLADAILRGLRQETAALTAAALETHSELEVVNRFLIPALDAVGERYERQELFLPQLIQAANAACEGFELVKKRIAQRGGSSVSKGKIVLATVHGDIHDIGKNIVRVVLENYGYTVIDLGRDVPAEEIVEAVVRENVRLVGLSALMTTTVASMAETIAAIRESGHDCRIMVGGAVLTPEYADEIGADYYAKDAKQSADIARQVLG
jgi:5-methyltetrahydrofolate--homocysteine methyltransferase